MKIRMQSEQNTFEFDKKKEKEEHKKFRKLRQTRKDRWQPLD